MGLFSNLYTKEGKGVDKNAPEKNSFFKFFELFRRHFSKLVTGNMLYVLLSLPVLSIGLARAGLTYICRAAARDQHTFAASDFFETIRKNGKQAFFVGLIDLIITFLLGYDIYWAYHQLDGGGIPAQIYFGVTLAVIILFRFSSYYRYSMVITFNMKLTKIYKNSFIFAMSAVTSNLIIGISHLLLYILAFLLIKFVRVYFSLTLLLVIYFLIYPAFSCFLEQYCTFGPIKKYMIDPYYEAHPDDDILLRRRLGLLPPEEDDFDYEAAMNEKAGSADGEAASEPSSDAESQNSVEHREAADRSSEDDREDLKD